MLWNKFWFDSNFIDKENVIAKLHLLCQLERLDPYSHSNVSIAPLNDRLATSLAYVPDKFRMYALALYANTIYFPNQFSHAILQHLMNKFIAKNNLNKNDFGKQCLILEQDPTGIVNEFLRRNAICGRLDKKTFQRTQQIKSFVNLVDEQINQKGLPIEESLLPFLDRNHWVVLADNSLSGTSICSDLKLLFDFAKRYEKNPKFTVLIRTLAYKGREKLNELYQTNAFDLNYGLLLTEQLSITPNNKHCSFFSSRNTLDKVIEASSWLASTDVYKNDVALIDHKKNSRSNDGDRYDMAFGFKECGLTFVSSENCPSDSLPLLWYSNPNVYIPPFPRVLSRVGGNL